jgi:hypothetical protein
MRIETGHTLTQNVKVLDGVKFVRFVVGDQTAFEVSIDKKAASIEVRSIDCVVHKGTLYDSLKMCVKPNTSNSVTISLLPSES